MPAREAADPGRVFERYRADVYRWAYRLLGRHHDALDVAQDVFLRWVEHAGRTAPGNPRAWLRRVTTNRAIDVLRVRRRSPASEGPPSGLSAPVEDDTLEVEDLRREIATALEGLTDAQRSVLIAKVYDGLTFAQIAAENHVAIPTAKTHYLRALTAVRDRLARRWGPERTLR